jgi:hypothetical protein
VSPIDGDAVLEAVAKMAAAPPALIERMRKLLTTK